LRSVPPVPLVAVVAALALGACKTTAEDIDKYKGAMNGVNFIGDAIASPGTDTSVQGKAIEALAELGEFKELEAALTLLKEDGGDGASHKAVDDAVARFEKVLEGSDDAAKERAKDGLFAVRAFASDDTAKKCDGLVLDWLTADVSGHVTKGAFTASTVVPAIGAPAVDALIAVLKPDAKNSDDLDKLAVPDLILKTATPAQKAEAAKHFVAFAKSLHPNLPGPVAVSLLNLGKEGGAAVAVPFFMEYAADRTAAPEGRFQAMSAMVTLATPDMRPAVEKIATDAEAPPGVRAKAFDILIKFKDPASLKILYPLSTDEKVQGAMGEVVVGVGGKEHVKEWLESIPTGKGVEYPRGVVQYWGQDIGKVGKADAAAIGQSLLKSKSWIARLTGISILEFNGTKADAASVKALAGEATTVTGPGWDAGVTVGKEATRVAALLEGK